MIAETLRRYLEAQHVTYHIHEHESRVTAQEVAQVSHVTGKQFAKGVLLKERGGTTSRFVLVVLPASEEVDLDTVGKQIGFAVELAPEEDTVRIFPDFELGAAPPIGELAARSLPLVVDLCLTHCEGLAFRAGSHTDVVEMPWGEYARIAAHRVVDFGRAPAPARSA